MKKYYLSDKYSIFLTAWLRDSAYERVFPYKKKKHYGQILYLCFYFRNSKIWLYVNCCGVSWKKAEMTDEYMQLFLK